MLAMQTTWVDLGDGRKVPADRLTRDEWAELRRQLRRYYSWLDSGKQVDPWQSGVASASRFDKPRIKHHKPAGGYDAGHCAEPEQDANLVDWHARITALYVSDQALLCWRFGQQQPIEECARRLGQSTDATEMQYRRLAVRLWRRLG